MSVTGGSVVPPEVSWAPVGEALPFGRGCARSSAEPHNPRPQCGAAAAPGQVTGTAASVGGDSEADRSSAERCAARASLGLRRSLHADEEGRNGSEDRVTGLVGIA